MAVPTRQTGVTSPIDLRAQFAKAAENIPTQLMQIKGMAQDFMSMIESGEAVEKLQEFVAKIGEALGIESLTNNPAPGPSASVNVPTARPSAPAPMSME